jgi:predicted HTH domain antitoxin
MIEPSDLVVPREFLIAARMSDDEMRVELATHLYKEKKLSMGKARRLAGIDLMSFQKELAKRNIYIHYTIEDLEQDLATLEKLEAKRSGK